MRPLMKFNFLFLALLFACNGLSAQSSTFEIDDCGVKYQGQRLQIGQDTSAWIAVLGPPTRRRIDAEVGLGILDWDPLGVGVTIGDKFDDLATVSDAYFFFMNNRSKEGDSCRMGNWMFFPFGFIDPYVGKRSPEKMKELMAEIPEMNQPPYRMTDPDLHFYTQSTLRSITMDGLVITPSSTIQSINRYRKEARLEPFVYCNFGTMVMSMVETPDSVYDPKIQYGFYRATLSPNRCQEHRWEKVLYYSPFHNLVYLFLESEGEGEGE